MISWLIRRIEYDRDAPLGYDVDDPDIPILNERGCLEYATVRSNRYGPNDDELHGPELYLDDPEWLREQYVVRSKAVSRIASQLDVREQRVRDALNDHSIYQLSSDSIQHNYLIKSGSDVDQTTVRQLYGNVQTPDVELDEEDAEKGDREPLFASDELVNMSRFADRVDIDPAVIYEHLRYHGIGVSDYSANNELNRSIDQDDLRQLHRGSFLDHVSESVSAQQLAADYDVPEDVVAEHCRQHDVVVEEDHLRGGDDSAADVINQYDIDPTQSVVETNSDDVGNVIDSLWTSAQTMFKTKTETETESSSTAKQKLRGVVEERYHPDDPRVPEAGTDDAIALADGADLLRVRTVTIEIQTLLDKIRGSQTEIEQIREIVVDLDGIDIEEGDEIVVDGQLIEEVADPESADLWLATDSSIARIRRDSDPILGDRIEIRDDQLDSEMSIRPFLDRRQQAQMLFQRLNRRAERLLEGAS